MPNFLMKRLVLFVFLLLIVSTFAQHGRLILDKPGIDVNLEDQIYESIYGGGATVTVKTKENITSISVSDSFSETISNELREFVIDGNITNLSFEEIGKIELLAQIYNIIYYEDGEWTGETIAAASEPEDAVAGAAEEETIEEERITGITADNKTPQKDTLDIIPDFTLGVKPMGDGFGEEEAVSEGRGPTLSDIIKVIVIGLIALFLIAAGYQIFTQRRATDLLSNDFRMQMLIELREADKIPTYFSNKYDKSKSTVSEHLEKLVQAGFVEKIEIPGKKFVYYRITRKGKDALRGAA
ncbi:MAG: hypothetical protein DRM99_05885 [Thermoplasmata archaeon]|nr:MAG: hypothetical protein DRM99_05885 [Thermoplasmata archaeon]